MKDVRRYLRGLLGEQTRACVGIQNSTGPAQMSYVPRAAARAVDLPASIHRVRFTLGGKAVGTLQAFSGALRLSVYLTYFWAE